MGMHDMREELEDLAFRTVNPEAYATIAAAPAETSARATAALIERIEQELTERLAKAGIKAEVKGREKRPYSIFRKMERKAISFEQLSDILGFRVVVGTVADCYAALGVVHTTWPTVPGRFKDYISTPKQNDYRSIHTTVDRPRQPARRTADAHRRDAPHRRIRHRRPRALQGRRGAGQAKANGSGNGAAQPMAATAATARAPVRR